MSVVVVVPDEMAGEISAALDEAGIAHGRAAATGLDAQVTVVPISLAKGLEVDGVVVVEPARIVSSEIQGLRALYVALTRPDAAPDDRPRRTAARAAGRRRRRAGRRRTHLRLTVLGGLRVIGRFPDAIVVTGARHERVGRRRGRRGCCRPCRRRRDGGDRRRCAAGRSLVRTRPGCRAPRASTPGRAAAQISVDALDGLVLALVCDDRLAQRAGLGEQLVEQLGGRAGGDELGGRRRVVSRRRPGCRGRPRSSNRRSSVAASRTPTPTAADRRPRGSHTDQDAGAGEGADADVVAADLDRQRAVRRHRRDRPVGARDELGRLEELEQSWRELELLGDPADRERLADVDRRQAVTPAARRSRSRGSGCRAGRWSGCRAGGPSPTRRRCSSRAPTGRPRGAPRPTTGGARR